jgi:hypothetical protein
MALTSPTSSLPGTWPSPDELRSLGPILRLLGGVWSIESVQKIALSAAAGHVDVWVLTRDEVIEDTERIAQFEREYRNAVSPLPFELHVVPLSEVDESALPPAETILQR